VTDSINRFTDNSCYIKCFFGKEDDIIMQQALEKLGEVGCADVFNSFNDIFYKHWVPFSGGAKVSLVESDLKTSVIVSSPDTELINEYRIGYTGDADTPLTDATGGNIGNISREYYGTHELTEMNCRENQEIVFKDITSAQYIGECYIKRLYINLYTQPRPPHIIQFDLKYTHREWVDLETYFRLTWSDEGWTEKLFEIFRITYDYDRNNIGILAYEVEE